VKVVINLIRKEIKLCAEVTKVYSTNECSTMDL
jgi:hypothetical protein